MTGTQPGEVVAAHCRHYLVDCGAAGLLSCVPRGKKSDCACGDRVRVRGTGPQQGVIEDLEPRKSEFFRAAGHRTKLIAANATQVAIIVAAEPSFSEELVARVLVACEIQGLKGCVVLNKSDLAAPFAAARERLRPFEQAGYEVVELAARRDVAPLQRLLRGQVTVLTGQSGMGKTTMLNSLIPAANAATQEISHFLDSGRHTTTAARLYRIDATTAVIDCPGLQEFGLAHLGFGDIAWGFPEFRPLLGACRFRDCRHDSDPDCAIRAASADGRIHPRRYELFRRIAAAVRA